MHEGGYINYAVSPGLSFAPTQRRDEQKAGIREGKRTIIRPLCRRLQKFSEWKQTMLSASPMTQKRRYLTATLSDGYAKTIGPTADPFTHYWRIVATLENGKTEVFWGHAKTLGEARKKRTATAEAAKMRGWKSYAFEIVGLSETPV